MSDYQRDQEINEYIYFLNGLLNQKQLQHTHNSSIQNKFCLNQTDPTNIQISANKLSSPFQHSKVKQQDCDQFCPFVEETRKFEDFLVEQQKRLQIESKCLGINPKQVKKIRYVQRHSRPQISLSYYGIKIYANFINFQKQFSNVILFPYEKVNAVSFSSLLRNDKLCLRLLKKLEKQENQVGSLSCHFSQNTYANRNYKWVYLYKKPHEGCLDYEAEMRLIEMIRKTLQNCIKFRVKKLVIPYFEWPRIKQETKSKLIMTAITNFISQYTRKQYLRLQQIKICYDQPKAYLHLSSQLKNISDQFLKHGCINS